MERGPWEAIIADAMQREDPAPTATETMRQAHETVVNSRHLLDIVEAYWETDVVPQIDAMVQARIPAADYARYIKDPARPAFLQSLRLHEIGGRSIPDVLDAITGRSLDGLRSIAAGLSGRLDREPQPELGKTQTWGERIPEAWRTSSDPFAERGKEAYRALEARHQELGEQLAEQPPHWALER
jgi:hypothetical protein